MPPRKPRPGDSKAHPLPAMSPEALKDGTRYEGWTCNATDCSRRVEIVEAVSDRRTPGDGIQGLWVKCAYCKTVDLYRFDRRTIEEYRQLNESTVAK
jgi:hypothetical protein